MPEVGQWGPEPFLDRRGRGLTNLTVSVYETDGSTLAVLYTDQTGTTVLANPLPIGVATTAAGLDVRGNVSFYAEPGAYELAADHDGSEVYRSPITVSVDTDTGGSGAVDSVNGLVGIVVLDASDIPFTPGGSIIATDVQAAIDEVALEAGAGGAPSTADYLTGTTQAGLSAEIVVGPTPGGELGGTWGVPTVDAVHSGSSHAAAQAAAEATAAAALSAHLTDPTDAHDASAVSFVPDGSIAATNVQAAIVEVRDEAGAGGAPTTADYLVGTAQGGLSAEIVVGATPGGELGGSWGSPTVDAVHSGSSHAATQAAAEATAATYADTKVSLTGAEVVAGVKTFTSDPIVPDEVYGAGWNGSLEPPTKNAVYDQIESVVAGTPALHAATHADGGTDEVALDASQIVSGILANARLDPDLAAIAVLTTTAYGRSVLETANAAALRTLAGLVIGTDIQAFDADLSALAAAGNSGVLAATTASFLTADETKLDGIEALADVTDATNVNAAGAVMESDFNAFTVLAADVDNTPLPLTMGASTILARLSSGGIVAASDTQVRTLLGLGSAALAALIDDDTFATATAANIASAESTKAYVDNEITDLPDLADGAGTVVTTPGGSVVIDLVSAVSEKTADYTLAVADEADVIRVNSATTKTVTLPQDSDAAIRIGTSGVIYQAGAGPVVIAAGTGATVIGTGGSTSAGSVTRWWKVAANTFLVESVQAADAALTAGLAAGTIPVMFDLAQSMAFGG